MSFPFAAVTNHHFSDSFNRSEVVKFLLWFILNTVQQEQKGCGCLETKLNSRIKRKCFFNSSTLIASRRLLCIITFTLMTTKSGQYVRINTCTSISVMILFTSCIYWDSRFYVETPNMFFGWHGFGSPPERWLQWLEGSSTFFGFLMRIPGQQLEICHERLF
jgi:hypothetical protein